jgi:hypothetical protein
MYRRSPASASAVILFDYSPDSALWSIQQEFPLSSDCANQPGKDLVSTLTVGFVGGREVMLTRPNRDLRFSAISVKSRSMSITVEVSCSTMRVYVRKSTRFHKT